jgi:hypothetical protein
MICQSRTGTPIVEVEITLHPELAHSQSCSLDPEYHLEATSHAQASNGTLYSQELNREDTMLQPPSAWRFTADQPQKVHVTLRLHTGIS